MNGSEDVGLSA